MGFEGNQPSGDLPQVESIYPYLEVYLGNPFNLADYNAGHTAGFAGCVV
ncbi:MAG: hypothetical protein ACYDB7_11880 [Mycobacteriales bacterium]